MGFFQRCSRQSRCWTGPAARGVPFTLRSAGRNGGTVRPGQDVSVAERKTGDGDRNFPELGRGVRWLGLEAGWDRGSPAERILQAEGPDSVLNGVIPEFQVFVENELPRGRVPRPSREG